MMLRFMPILERTNIEMADLPPAVELNGCLLYLGAFPEGAGRLLVNPRIQIDDNPDCVALVAHELAHMLLHIFDDHPPSVVDLLYDPEKRALYDYYERQADRLAAHLLVPPEILAEFPSERYPTVESLAHALGVPTRVVRLALDEPHTGLEPVRGYLQKLTGRRDFVHHNIITA